MVCMGTRFIATREAAVTQAQKDMMVAAGASDVLITPNLTGADAAFLKPSIRENGLDPEALPPIGAPDATRESKAWRDIWSAGHGVGSIEDIPSVADLADRLVAEYDAAIARLVADPFARRRAAARSVG